MPVRKSRVSGREQRDAKSSKRVPDARESESPAKGHARVAAQAMALMSDAGETNSSATGRSPIAVKAMVGVLDADAAASGQVHDVTATNEAMPEALELDSRASVRNRKGAEPETGLPDVRETINLIRSWHRERCYAMESRKIIDLRLGSYLRMVLGWSLALPDAERKAIAEQAQELMSTGDPDGDYTAVILASAAARKPFDDIEAKALKEMTALAKTLPVWSAFGENVRGFGAASLAVIVGEAGDLANYSSVSKLWKRMGLAVIDGARQGAPGRGADAETWIEHGYNPVRRSRMWNIGDALIKSNRDGGYRTAYLARKEYELARDPECKPIKAHRRAQRYMEKRLLKHLWQAWRRTVISVDTNHSLSASPVQDREAVQLM